MPTISDALSFSDWIDHVFDHPVAKGDDKAWYWNDDAPEWDVEQHLALARDHVTRLFRDPMMLDGAFSNAQIDQGLWYVANGPYWSYMSVCADASAPSSDVDAFITSIAQLYEKGFSRWCTRHYCHLDRGPELAAPTNNSCYMFWEIAPFWPVSSGEEWRKTRTPEYIRRRAEIEESMVSVMERTLNIDHVACQEGSLHGLGHWGLCLQRPKKIITRFLDRGDLAPEIREYGAQGTRRRDPVI